MSFRRAWETMSVPNLVFVPNCFVAIFSELGSQVVNDTDVWTIGASNVVATYNFTDGRNDISVSGNDISVSGNDISVSGNDISVSGNDISVCNDISVSGNDISVS
ncbi:hypothetical protein CEXT_120741 [Caerostris extrusa]|uniref:Uncharacterized protein n=1 Tax=Caerostris extrusa TaxID=172846 RepID=A0AAV4PQA3_CAEEX|nr:hypothetical protein CEXT_120741 [Caerostris extrusa]